MHSRPTRLGETRRAIPIWPGDTANALSPGRAVRAHEIGCSGSYLAPSSRYIRQSARFKARCFKWDCSVCRGHPRAKPWINREALRELLLQPRRASARRAADRPIVSHLHHRIVVKPPLMRDILASCAVSSSIARSLGTLAEDNMPRPSRRNPRRI